MHTETYYVIRVGDPRRHTPYYWCDGETTPVLFLTRFLAEKARTAFDEVSTKVVRVKLIAK